MKKILSKSIMILVLVIMCFTALSLTACSKGDDGPMIKSVTYYYSGTSKITRKPIYIYKITSVLLYSDNYLLENITTEFNQSSSKKEYFILESQSESFYYTYCPFNNSDLKLNSVQSGLGQNLVSYYSYKHRKYVSVRLGLNCQQRIDISISNKDSLSTIRYPVGMITQQPLKNVEYSMNTVTIPTSNIIEIKY